MDSIDDISQQVRPRVALWHELQREIDAAATRALAERGGADALLRNYSVYLAQHTNALRDDFGIDPEAATDKRLLPHFHVPASELELVILELRLMFFAVYSAALKAGGHAYAAAVAAGEDPTPATAIAMKRSVRDGLVLTTADTMANGLTEQLRASATYTTAAWARTGISPKKNQRLDTALHREAEMHQPGDGPDRVERQLLERLPAAVRIAFADRRPGQPVDDARGSVLSKIVKDLEGDGPYGKGGEDLPVIPDIAHGGTEDLTSLLAQKAELTSALRTLSRQERTVWELDARGYKSTEIAAALGITPGTVRTLRRRADQKLSKLHIRT